MARIDVHAHIFPADYLDALDQYRGSADGTAAVRGPGPGTTEDDVAARLAVMDNADVELQLLSVAPQFPAFEDAEQSSTAARLANNGVAAVVRDHRARFRGLAVVPMPHTRNAVDEAHRALEELGLDGIATGATVLGRSLADDYFEPLLRYLNDREAILFVHPVGDGLGSPLLAALGWVTGHATELTLAAVELIQKDLLRTYPKIRFLFPHMCGYAPFIAQRLDLHADWYLPAGRPPVAEQLKLLHYDTANPTPGALEQTIGVVGASQLMVGTDFPFETGESLMNHLTYIGKSGIPADQITAIESENARRFLRL
ncbi:amidohydrolase family protein [Nocardia sp. NPDC006630]|uniref:amidohydrolase family protein n=1 Tax=Nocardia sp. NPDC006630 TaxID=3157181 RepID=UPI00339F6653